MSTCTGKCCAVFNYPTPPDELRARWAKRPTTDRRCYDDLLIASMLIELSPIDALARAEKFDITPPEGYTLETWAENTPAMYTCRHWDEDTRLCGIYEDRPKMCRDYPYDNPCQHDCNCTYRPDEAVQEFWRKVHA